MTVVTEVEAARRRVEECEHAVEMWELRYVPLLTEARESFRAAKDEHEAAKAQLKAAQLREKGKA